MVSGVMPPQTSFKVTLNIHQSMLEKPSAHFNVYTFVYNHNLIT